MFGKLRLITRSQLFEWALFALIAFAVCLLLAFRPIPGVSSKNDTGRYLSYLGQYCGNGLSRHSFLNKEISYQIFYTVASTACFSDSDGIFLFQVAAYLPLMFLAFSRWRNGTFLWACSLIFSVYGLELMTNAMRQELAMLLFFGGMSLIQIRPRQGLFLCLLGTAAHTSVLAFLPLLLWMARYRLSRQGLRVGVALILFLILIAGVVYYKEIPEFFSGLSSLNAFYTNIYAKQLNPAFMIFMALPLYFVYGLRFLFERGCITSAERVAFVYSNIVILISLIFFPAITFRLAIFAVPLQIFLVSLSERHSVKMGSIALIGMIIHLSIMLAISENYSVLING